MPTRLATSPLPNRRMTFCEAGGNSRSRKRLSCRLRSWASALMMVSSAKLSAKGITVELKTDAPMLLSGEIAFECAIHGACVKADAVDRCQRKRRQRGLQIRCLSDLVAGIGGRGATNTVAPHPAQRGIVGHLLCRWWFSMAAQPARAPSEPSLTSVGSRLAGLWAPPCRPRPSWTGATARRSSGGHRR